MDKFPQQGDLIIDPKNLILITGSNGFIGSRVVQALLWSGFSNVRCFVRPSSNLLSLQAISKKHPDANLEFMVGNLLSREDCTKATKNASVILHLAAGIEKSFAGSFLNSVVTTRNLLDAARESGSMRRFVNVSSFAVYSNWEVPRGKLLDETCKLEAQPVERAEAYTFAKLRQDKVVIDYGRKYNVPYVIVRPGAVYGPGVRAITARVGIDTFGLFLHLGGSNQIPITYVDNCAQAIVLAGIKSGIDGEVFNVVDDDLPSSRTFLRMYKKYGRTFRSLYIPYFLSYFLCWLWEKYSIFSEGQVPPIFNRRRCAAYWKGNKYTNQKLKVRLGWKPTVPFSDASREYFSYIRGNA